MIMKQHCAWGEFWDICTQNVNKIYIDIENPWKYNGKCTIVVQWVFLRIFIRTYMIVLILLYIIKRNYKKY